MIKKIEIRGLSVVVLAMSFLALDSGTVEAKTYKMAMSWLFEASHTGYLAAQDKGFYAQEGVEVKVERGFGAGDTLRRLVTGDIDIGIVDATILIKAMSEDPESKMVMLSNILQTSPYNVLYVKDRKIDGVGDLASAAFGDSSGSVARLYPTFMQFAMKTVGKPADRYNTVNLDPGLRIPALFGGDVDVVGSVIFEFPNVNHRAKEAGLELGTFNYADYGFDPYTYGIVVKADLVKSNPGDLKGIVKGTLLGWKWACENPSRAAELLWKYHSDVPKETIPDELNLALKHVWAKDAKKKGLGYMNPQRWQETYELALLGWDIRPQSAPPLEIVYRTDFMPNEPVMAKCMSN